MKKVIALAAIGVATLLAQGCGVSESLSEQCKGSDVEMGCNTVFGYRDNEQDDKLARKIEEAKFDLDSIIIQMNSFQIAITTALLNDSTNASRITALEGQVYALQIQANTLMNQLAVLSTQEFDIDLIDPCGDGPGFDEVLIRTPTKIIAYFEQGSHRAITSLGVGFYQTTDPSKCNFTVNAQLQICDSSGCH